MTRYLPPLAGTRTQVAWATDIRAREIDGLAPSITQERQEAVKRVLVERDAEWWIDIHLAGVSLDEIVDEVEEEIRQRPERRKP